MESCAHTLLRRTAEERPEAAAVHHAAGSVTWAELDRAHMRIAAILRGRGVGRGDRVLVQMENTPGCLAALFGIMACGAVAVPLHPSTKDHRVAHVLADCTPHAALVEREPADTMRSALALAASRAALVVLDAEPPGAEGGAGMPRMIDEDLAAIIYTSGTTGTPKGVMLPHRTVCNNVRAISSYLSGSADDVVGMLLPVAFSYGLFQAMVAVHDGSTLVLERSFAFPAESMARLAQHRVTGLPLVPSLIAPLVDLLPGLGLDLASLRYVTSAAAPLPPAHVLRLRQLLPHVRLFSMYGQTECTRISFLDPQLVEERPHSVGRAMPNTEAVVVDDDGRPLPPGSEGELVVRGANVMRGYWSRPVETAAAVRVDPVTGDRLLHTGDIFRMDEDGCLTFLGRKDDLFKCRGEKVAPREVESVIYELPGVAEVAVTGVPHPADGRAVKAIVVAREGAALDPALVRRHCARRLEPHLVPRFVELAPDLPRTASGKVERAALA